LRRYTWVVAVIAYFVAAANKANDKEVIPKP
jgi:hypothetical protein